MKPIVSPRVKLFWIGGLCLTTFILIFVFSDALSAHAQVSIWSSPTIISEGEGYSWFPDLAIDEAGRPHVIWCETIPIVQNDIPSLIEQVDYTQQTDYQWVTPNDIIPPSSDIIRNAIASDLKGNILLLYSGSVHGRTFSLYFKEADRTTAWSAKSWSSPIMINRGSSYMSDIAVDSKGRIHAIFDDMVRRVDQDSTVFADIYYRQSNDDGNNWSGNINLFSEPETGSARPYMEIDSSDNIHVTWDEGWDRLTGADAGKYHSVYMNSQDGGISWSEPKIIYYPQETAVQLTAGSDGKGGVMLVWRSHSTLYNNFYYQWSTDNGDTWGVPKVISGTFARPWTNPYDMYDMASDSAGNIHLLVTGRETNDDIAPLGVYHLIWDGSEWSTPENIFSQDNLFPEYPKVVISTGNQIHAAWFTREGSVWDQTVNRVIWYSHSEAPAPAVTLTPRPATPTIPLPTLTKTVYPSATPRPTVSSVGINTNSPIKEMEYLKILAMVLSPVVLLVGAIFIGKYIKNHK